MKRTAWNARQQLSHAVTNLMILGFFVIFSTLSSAVTLVSTFREDPTSGSDDPEPTTGRPRPRSRTSLKVQALSAFVDWARSNGGKLPKKRSKDAMEAALGRKLQNSRRRKDPAKFERGEEDPHHACCKNQNIKKKN